MPNPTLRALSDLASQLNGAVLMGHSQSGSFPLAAALLNPAAARGLVLVEPVAARRRTPPSSKILANAAGPRGLRRLTAICRQASDIAHVATRFEGCQALIGRIKGAGGRARCSTHPTVHPRQQPHDHAGQETPADCRLHPAVDRCAVSRRSAAKPRQPIKEDDHVMSKRMLSPSICLPRPCRIAEHLRPSGRRPARPIGAAGGISARRSSPRRCENARSMALVRKGPCSSVRSMPARCMPWWIATGITRPIVSWRSPAASINPMASRCQRRAVRGDRESAPSFRRHRKAPRRAAGPGHGARRPAEPEGRPHVEVHRLRPGRHALHVGRVAVQRLPPPPMTSAIVRMKPDGSGMEVVRRGRA